MLVPGGPTDTPLIADESGWDRTTRCCGRRSWARRSRWLLSDESASFNGQRITAARWDAKLPGAEAAKKASRAIGWPELGSDAVWLAG